MGFCREFHGAFKWGQRNYWQRGLLQHATNVGHMMFAALVHTPCSQHRYVSQSASNGLCMYSMEYLSDRVNVRAAGEVCFLACWLDIGRPYVLKKAQIGVEKEADSDSHCTVLCVLYLFTHASYIVFDRFSFFLPLAIFQVALNYNRPCDCLCRCARSQSIKWVSPAGCAAGKSGRGRSCGR